MAKKIVFIDGKAVVQDDGSVAAEPSAKAGIIAEQVAQQQAMLSAASNAVMADAEVQVTQMMTSISEEVGKMFNEFKEQVDEAAKGHVIGIQINTEPIKAMTGSGAIPDCFDRCMRLLRLGITPLLYGESGVGKTWLAEMLAEALGVPFYLDTGAADRSLNSYFTKQTAGGAWVDMPLIQACKSPDGGLLLLDEFDANDENVGVGLNAVLDVKKQGKPKAFMNPSDGTLVTVPDNVYIITAANTQGRGADFKFTGRNRLDRATTKRLKGVYMDWNAKADEMACPDTGLRNRLLQIRKELLRRQSEETVSTRDLYMFHLEVVAGGSVADCLESLCTGWPQETIDTCVVPAFKVME